MPVGLGAMVAMSAVPAVVQGVQGFIQSGKARKMLDNLERPQYEIPQSVMQGTQRAINAASSFQMPGQDAYQQSIDQASSGALYNITQNATSGPEALAAMTGVYGAQMGAQNQMALAAAQDYQRRDQLAQQALMTRGEYEDKAWMTNVYQPYAEEAQAASALAEAGKINAYQAVKGLAGVGANALMMKSMGMFDNPINKQGVNLTPYNNAVGQSMSNVQGIGGTLKSFNPASTPQFNPNLQGFNSIGQPQFKSIMERVRSSSPMMGDANATSVIPGQTTGIQFNTIPGVTDGLAESPLVNQQPFNDVVNQATGGNSFTTGTANNGGVGALNVTPPVVSNTAPVQPTAVIPSQPAPVVPAPVVPAPAVPAPAIVSPGFAQAQQTMNAVQAGAIPEGEYIKDQMQAQDVAAAAAAAPSGDVKSSGDNTFTSANGNVWKSKEDYEKYRELERQRNDPSVRKDKELDDKLYKQLSELRKEVLISDATPDPNEAAPATPAVVAPEAPAISKITPLQSTIQMVSRLPMDIIKSSPSLQKFAEQASTEPENGEVTMTYKSEELLGTMPGQTRRWEPYTKEVPLPMVNGVVDWRAAVNNYQNSEDCKAGKCYSSTSAHSPAWFAIPMLGDLIDQEGYFKDIDDLNEKRGTSLSPKDQKNAIEFLFKEDLSEDEKKWLERATHPKGSLQSVKNKMKPKLKALKEEYPDLYADIVDDEGNYIGSSKATPSEGAAFKFGDSETSSKVATDPNIPWKDFMQGNWTYEGEECNMKGKCPSDDDRDGARRTIGSMVYMDDFPRISKESDENMSAETFIERVNTEGTKENKLWKTAMLPMPATMAMIENRYKK